MPRFCAHGTCTAEPPFAVMVEIDGTERFACCSLWHAELVLRELQDAYGTRYGTPGVCMCQVCTGGGR
jgi:hypothetical protein